MSERILFLVIALGIVALGSAEFGYFAVDSYGRPGWIGFALISVAFAGWGVFAVFVSKKD